ncbi:MAG: hypothetical protein R2828_25535 [Saprospiraceae bacterium]
MEALIHLFIEIIKITIFTIVYSFIIVKLLEVISKKKPRSRLSFYLNNKIIIRALRALISIVIFIGLFIWMFSFWGNHGFGDSARIPVGNKIAVENINWTEYGYIKKEQISNAVNIETTRFKITGNKILGNFDSDFYTYQNKYFIFNTENKSMLEFKTVKEFDLYTEKNNLPSSDELLSFRANYESYWHGWRFWLLP